MDVRLGSMAEGLVGEPVPTALSYGLPGSLAPIFQVIPSDVEVLGTDEQGNPTLVRKHLEGRTSIFSAAPNMPAGLLRLFARQAGVHLYSESGDRIYANRAFVAVASDAGGRRGIRLPQPADVYELPERNLISGNTDQLVLDVPAGGVRLLELRPTGAQP